jgi:hypothetical protein
MEVILKKGKLKKEGPLGKSAPWERWVQASDIFGRVVIAEL